MIASRKPDRELAFGLTREQFAHVCEIYPTQGKCRACQRHYYFRGRLRDRSCPVHNTMLDRTSEQSRLERYVILDRRRERTFPGEHAVDVFRWLGITVVGEPEGPSLSDQAGPR